VLEGHYIRGYGDTQKPDVEIALLPNSSEKVEVFLRQHPEAVEKLEKVADIVDGFETPYGLELLASVHWLMVHDGEAVDADSAITAMAAWNERKRQLFKPEHIRVAWARLQGAL